MYTLIACLQQGKRECKDAVTSQVAYIHTGSYIMASMYMHAIFHKLDALLLDDKLPGDDTLQGIVEKYPEFTSSLETELNIL